MRLLILFENPKDRSWLNDTRYSTVFKTIETNSKQFLLQ